MNTTNNNKDVSLSCLLNSCRDIPYNVEPIDAKVFRFVFTLAYKRYAIGDRPTGLYSRNDHALHYVWRKQTDTYTAQNLKTIPLCGVPVIKSALRLNSLRWNSYGEGCENVDTEWETYENINHRLSCMICIADKSNTLL